MIYIVLAAGVSRRMGFAKVFAPLPDEGVTPLERIAAFLDGREWIAVVPSAHRDAATRMAAHARLAMNDSPARGMTHSLRCGLEFVDAASSFGVLLGDKPFLKPATLDRMETEFAGFDVAYPVSVKDVPGHPVLFSPRVREILSRLPDGDALAQLRDHPSLRRSAVRIDDPGAFLDLDEPAQWKAVRDA